MTFEDEAARSGSIHKNRAEMREEALFFSFSATYRSLTTNPQRLPNYNHKHSAFTTTLWDNMKCWQLKNLATNSETSLSSEGGKNIIYLQSGAGYIHHPANSNPPI